MSCVVSTDAVSAGATAPVPATMYHIDHVAIIPNFRALLAEKFNTTNFECGQLAWYITSACCRAPDGAMCMCCEYGIEFFVSSLRVTGLVCKGGYVRAHVRRLMVFPRGVGNAPGYVSVFLECLDTHKFRSKHVDCTVKVQNLRGATLDASLRTCRAMHGSSEMRWPHSHPMRLLFKPRLH
jgi:hypothetical protein